MSTVQLFSLEAANAMVPQLTELVGLQLERRSEIEAKIRQLSELVGDVPEEIAPEESDPSSVRDMKNDLLARIEAYQDGWREVEALGVVLKDARTGLLDFYGNVAGRNVWLCWKFGEKEVCHYHALDEGYSSRKEILAPDRQRLLN